VRPRFSFILEFDGFDGISAKRLITFVRSTVSAAAAKVRPPRNALVPEPLPMVPLRHKESVMMHPGLHTPPSTPRTMESPRLFGQPTPKRILTDTESNGTGSFNSGASTTRSVPVSPKNTPAERHIIGIGNAAVPRAHARSGVLDPERTIA